MAKTITFTLDSASIEAAVTELNNFIDNVRQMMGELVKQLTEQGVQIAMTNIASFGAVDTGELSDSMWGFYDEDAHVGIIRSNAYYAVFVEYGTGIVGSMAAHPDLAGEWLPPGGWTYDHNGHGENGWFYTSDRDGKRHWTRGQVRNLQGTPESGTVYCGKNL